jgi:hypothetical protein
LAAATGIGDDGNFVPNTDTSVTEAIGNQVTAINNASPVKEAGDTDDIGGLFTGDESTGVAPATKVTYTGSEALSGTEGEAFEVPENKTLVIAGTIENQEAAITVAEGGTLKVEGSITTSGDLTVADGGALEVAGSLTTSSELKVGENGTLEVEGSLEVSGEDGKLEIAADAKVTVTGDLTIGSASPGEGDTNGTLTVEGEITVGEEGTLTLESGSAGNLNGTITVGDGGVLKDLNSAGGTVWGSENDEGKGSIVVKSGAKAYVGTDTVAMISDATHTDAAPVLIQLTEGGFTLTKNGYSLDGKATLHGIFGLGGENETITLSATSVLTIAATWAPTGEPSADYPGLWLVINGTSIVGETVGTDSSKIVIVDGGIYITGGTNNFYDGTTLITGSGVIIVPAGTYNWDATLGSNAGGWKAEAAAEPEPEPAIAEPLE